jgi:hypothetical protein
MNRKLKQVAARASRAGKSLSQGCSSSSSRGEAMLRCARAEEEEEQCVDGESRSSNVLRRSRVVRRSGVVRRNMVLRRSSVVRRSGVVRRNMVLRRSSMVRRRLSLNVCRGRLGGATWLHLLLRPHGKRIGF